MIFMYFLFSFTHFLLLFSPKKKSIAKQLRKKHEHISAAFFDISKIFLTKNANVCNQPKK